MVELPELGQRSRFIEKQTDEEEIEDHYKDSYVPYPLFFCFVEYK